MPDFNIDSFQQAVVKWANYRNNNFKQNWVVKGGWEGWIQVDLVAFILSVEQNYDILREQPIYISKRKRVDLLLNTNLRTNKQIAIEVKAESWENRRNSFINGILDDMNKLDEERNSNFKKSDCIMMVLPFSPESLDDVNAIEAEDTPVFNTIFTGEVAICFAVNKWPDGWLPKVIQK